MTIEDLISSNSEAGTYQITYKGNEYEITLPDNVKDVKGVVLQGYGGGGRSDNNAIKKYLEENETNTINIFPIESKDFLGDEANKITSELATEICDLYDIPQSNYMPKGYSASARDAIKDGYQYSLENEDITNMNVFCLEPSVSSINIFDQDLIDRYKEKNITVIHLSGNKMRQDYEAAAAAGLPMLDIQVELTQGNSKITNWETIHGATQNIISDCDYESIASKTFNLNSMPKTITTGSNTYNVNYTYRINDNGSFKTISATEANKIINSYANNDVKAEKNIEETNLSEETIESNLELLESEILKITAKLKGIEEIKVIESLQESYDSTTKVPSMEPSSISSLIVSSTSLFGKLATELNSVLNIGIKINENDGIMKKMADLIMTTLINGTMPKEDSLSNFNWEIKSKKAEIEEINNVGETINDNVLYNTTFTSTVNNHEKVQLENNEEINEQGETVKEEIIEETKKEAKDNNYNNQSINSKTNENKVNNTKTPTAEKNNSEINNKETVIRQEQDKNTEKNKINEYAKTPDKNKTITVSKTSERNNKNNSNDIVRKIAIGTGIGAALGGGALGTKKFIDKKKENDEV